MDMESLEELYLDESAMRELPLVIKILKRVSFAKSSTSRDGIGIGIGWGLDCLFGSSDDNEPGSDSSDDDDEPISKRFKNAQIILCLVQSFNEMNWEKLMKMAGAVHTGGKGSMRRVARYSSQYIISHLGPDNLDNLMKLAEQFQKQAPGAGAAGGTTPQEDDDDEVPELVAGENFEAAAEEKQAS